MSKTGKAVAAATAVAAGPSGLRRLAGGCLVVVLIAGLGLAGLLAVVAWMSTPSGVAPALPCPPDSVAVAYGDGDGTPAEVREAVEKAVIVSGRAVTDGGWSDGLERDLVVVWTPGADDRLGRSGSPTKLTLGQTPTAAEITALLGDRLAPCEASAPTATPVQGQDPTPAGQQPSERRWPWSGGITPVAGVGLAALAWWLAGPQIVRLAWSGLWPVRLGWRYAQRWHWRWLLRHGQPATEWPNPIRPGEAWHHHPAAMHDRRTLREQIAEGEPERRAAYREATVAALEAAPGAMSAFLRLVYRVPRRREAPVGTPEKEEVSND